MCTAPAASARAADDGAVSDEAAPAYLSNATRSSSSAPSRLHTCVAHSYTVRAVAASSWTAAAIERIPCF